MEDEPGLRQALRENGYMARRRARGIRRGRGGNGRRRDRSHEQGQGTCLAFSQAAMPYCVPNTSRRSLSLRVLASKPTIGSDVANELANDRAEQRLFVLRF